MLYFINFGISLHADLCLQCATSVFWISWFHVCFLNFMIKCNSPLCHIRMTFKAQNIHIITMWKEKSPAKNEMSLQNSINRNLRRISPWSKRFGGKTGETGLQERLVRTKAAMCSSIISVSMSLEFLNAPFCWISPWSWDRE